MTPYIFALIFAPFAIAVGELVHHHGKKLLVHAFGDAPTVSSALAVLLRTGFYLVALGLLMWNLGIESNDHAIFPKPRFTELFLRLGVSIFILGFLHGFNVLALSLFHRKARP
jgi:hypothetical protein